MFNIEPHPVLTFCIQWGRARAIQGAYCRIIEQMTFGKDLISLSVGDVYSWLSENGHFPMVLEDQSEPHETKHDENRLLQLNDRALDRWCGICGLDVAGHWWESVCKEEKFVQDVDIRKPVSEVAISHSRPKSANQCHIVPLESQTKSFPVIDIRRIISGQSKQMAVYFPTGLYSPKTLLAVGDPLLIASISRMVNSIGLKRFAPLDVTSNQIVGHGKIDIERNLAPFALLAVMAKIFIRLLVKRGLEVVTRDQKNGAAFSSKFLKRRNESTTRMLTPTHVLNGVVSRGRDLDNVMWCLARLGIGVSEDVSSKEMRIKMEVG